MGFFVSCEDYKKSKNTKKLLDLNFFIHHKLKWYVCMHIAHNFDTKRTSKKIKCKLMTNRVLFISLFFDTIFKAVGKHTTQ